MNAKKFIVNVAFATIVFVICLYNLFGAYKTLKEESNLCYAKYEQLNRTVDRGISSNNFQLSKIAFLPDDFEKNAKDLDQALKKYDSYLGMFPDTSSCGFSYVIPTSGRPDARYINYTPTAFIGDTLHRADFIKLTEGEIFENRKYSTKEKIPVIVTPAFNLSVGEEIELHPSTDEDTFYTGYVCGITENDIYLPFTEPRGIDDGRFYDGAIYVPYIDELVEATRESDSTPPDSVYILLDVADAGETIQKMRTEIIPEIKKFGIRLALDPSLQIDLLEGWEEFDEYSKMLIVPMVAAGGTLSNDDH